ncbi:hypothetical protein CNYM01_10776 [Colletotrichum nymphaeae SA-01]|uniref:Uncharacterized protein n=1 Tax=Colletotrichum nymphaeae SA-01 TaxID=1460502 RepID=A0A135SZN9_9PEZI|nr:hypothetical protein CNYM01_10776 [Colletotrichum nymphaeae SA-01]
MDPVNAVGLAAAILQFVEFTAKLFRDGQQILDSAQGATVENGDIEAVTQSLVTLTRQMPQHNTCDDPPAGSLRGSSFGPAVSTEQNLNDLGASCQAIADELLDALKDLKAPNSKNKWTSIFDALKTVWSSRKIEGLRKRLEQFRIGIHTALLVSLRDGMSKITADLEKLRRGDDVEMLKADVLQAIQELRAETVSETDSSNIRQEIMSSLMEVTTKERTLAMQRSLIRALYIRTRSEREHRIAETHAKTFQWIWADPRGQPDKPWSNFPAWLESDNKIYWMTGKPGSGKSTMMKYVVHEQECKESLKRWSGTLPLIVTKFYLWNSGSQDQMSQEGLIRTILHDALLQRPELIPKILAKRWQRCQHFGSDLRDWSGIELEQSFEALAKSATEDNFKICLFIDGLDEFDGDHNSLIRLFRRVISFPNVKVCLSSRPWNVFEEAFQNEPNLRLEDITFPDIIAYITDHLTANSGYAALKRREPEFSSALIQNIARKSSGVFLWVTLVVKSLLAGLTNRDRVSDLQQRLDELPEDLEDFYQKIFDSIEPRYAIRANQLFRLIEASQGDLTALGLSFVDGDAPDILKLAIEAAVSPLGDQERLDRYEDTRRQINGRCKGFLELPYNECDRPTPCPSEVELVKPSQNESSPVTSRRLSTSGHTFGETQSPSDVTAAKQASLVQDGPIELRRVTYLHRTARDFLQSPHIRKSILTNSAIFDPNTSLLCAHIRMIKTWELSYQRRNELQDIGRNAMSLATVADISDVTRAAILDELNKSMKLHHGGSNGHIFGVSYCEDGNWASAIIPGYQQNGKWAPSCGPGYCEHRGDMDQGSHRASCKPARGSEAPKTFLGLAASYSLNHYISLKILGKFSIFPDQSEVPLLYRVISQYDIYPAFRQPHFSAEGGSVPDGNLVQELFRQGTSPNFEIAGQTIWECALKKCAEFSRNQLTLEQQYLEQESKPRLRYWAQIIELFIQYGADPRINRNSEQGSYIREAFGALLPNEARRLDKQMTRKKHLWSAKGRFLHPPQAPGEQSTPLTRAIPILNSLQKVVIPGLTWSERWRWPDRERDREDVSTPGSTFVVRRNKARLDATVTPPHGRHMTPYPSSSSPEGSINNEIPDGFIGPDQPAAPNQTAPAPQTIPLRQNAPPNPPPVHRQPDVQTRWRPGECRRRENPDKPRWVDD